MKNYRKIFLFQFLLFSSYFFSQHKIYFNKDWNVTTANKSVYYREVKKNENLFQIKDFYKNGQLQMEGFSTNSKLNDEVFQGKVTWYFENGKIQKTAEFKDGEQVGIEKEYDEEGRIITDITYSENGFSGIKREYKNEENITNQLWEYKDSDVIKHVSYDENPNGIRIETYMPEGSISNGIEKYYDEKSNAIGEKHFNTSDDFKNTEVEYYYNPMKVYRITKENEKGYEQEIKAYYPNGKLKYEEYYTKDGYKIAYDEKGVVLGKILYTSRDSYEWYNVPWNGDDVIFDEDNLMLKSIVTYKDGVKIKVKVFYPNGDKKIIDYVDGKISKTEYFDEKEKSIGTMIYDENEQPVNGTRFDFYEGKTSSYNNGKLIIETKKDEEGDLIYEKKYNEIKKAFSVKIFNKDQSLCFSYEVPENAEDELFTSDISVYKNGKEESKIKILDGILQNGKIVFEYKNSKKVFEKNGNLIILKRFDENNSLVDETKDKAEANNPQNYYGKRIRESDFLNYRDVEKNEVSAKVPYIQAPTKK